ncbi:MAG: hypothetical protein FJ267_02590, partial [Planctomycetes bacterium]|nr:hypothetical protein [Planctomycetota bacterium]
MLTDVSFCLTFLGVLIGFGGRAALGQLVLVTGTVLTATLWILHQWTSRQVTYQWSGSELFWLGGIAVAVSQVMHLPDEWLTRLAPNLSTTLPLWFDANRPKIVSSGWHQLSLAPWETLSGLAVFLAYAILFLVMTQRVASESDVKRVMMSVCLATVGMAL